MSTLETNIKERFKSLYQILTQGCGREYCPNSYCFSSPCTFISFKLIKPLFYRRKPVYKSFETKEKLVAQALTLLKTPVKICLTPSKPPHSLQITELEAKLSKMAPTEEYDTREICKRVFDVFNNFEALSLSFRESTDLHLFRPSETQHCVDLAALSHFFYKLMPRMKILKEELLACVRDSLKAFVKNPELCVTTFNSPNELRVFFIYFQMPELLEFENLDILSEIINILLYLPPWALNTMKNWLSSLTQDLFINMITQLQQIISVFVANENLIFETQFQSNNLLFERFLGMIKEPKYTPLAPICSFLQLFYEANHLKPKAQEILFKNSSISNDITVIYQYRAWKKNQEFTFCSYSWLLEVDFKAKILEEESKEEQELEKKKGLGVLNQMIHQNPLGMMFNPGELMYFTLQIRRDHIIEDSLNALMQKSQQTSFKKKLKIKFVGEPGVDEGGLKKEFFQILIKQLFDPNYGMFVQKMVIWGFLFFFKFIYKKNL